MGMAQRPCCKTVANAPQPVASLQPVPQIHSGFAAIVVTPLVEILLVSEAKSAQAGLGLPPPAPPRQSPILRI